MLATQPDLAARITAAIRVGDRRWNLRIDNAIDVLLPAEHAVGAWSRLASLERSTAILKREVQTIDLRLPDRLVLRVTPEAVKEAPARKERAPRGEEHMTTLEETATRADDRASAAGRRNGR